MYANRARLRERDAMNPQTEARQFKRFMDAVDRGKELHPGPYTPDEWQRDLVKERLEADAEICSLACFRCGFTEGSPDCIAKLKRRQSELLDEAVVSYRSSMAMDDTIREKE